MLHKINPFFKDYHMIKPILCGFLVLLLIPFSNGFAQEFSDNAPTLSVSLSNVSPYVYQDSDGFTVVVGIVENNDLLSSVSNVRIQANFFNEFDPNPIESVEGTSVLDVIPAGGQSPYMIKSNTANSSISEASVSLLNFDSSLDKHKGLKVYSSEVFSDTSFRFSGILENGGAPSTDTKVHIAFYDGFNPPRILEVFTLDIGKVDPNTDLDFSFEEQIDPRSVGFLLFAESNIFYSDIVDVKIPPPQSLTKIVTISDVSVKDQLGNKLSEIKVGTTVHIESETWVQFATNHGEDDETPYTYYVQIKESGKTPFVEFIGKYDGRFIGTGLQSQIVDWIPEKKGLFFIETFVWDKNNIPIAEQGPFVLIIVT